MPPAAIAASVVAASTLVGGIASANASHYKATVAANNATIAKQNAGYAASATAAQTEDAGLKARSQSANVRAGLAASGVDVNSGSAAAIQTGQREIGNLDTQRVASRGGLQVYGYEAQSANFQAESNLDEKEAQFAVPAAILKGAGQFASLDPGAFGGGGGSGGGGSSFTDSPFNQSLLSGEPSLNGNYTHMYSSLNPTDPSESGIY